MSSIVKIFLAVFALIMLSVSSAYAIFCAKCGTENPDDAKFCYRCGAELTGGTSPGYLVCHPETMIDGMSTSEFRPIIPNFDGFLTVIKLPCGKHVVGNKNFILKPSEIRYYNRQSFETDHVYLQILEKCLKGDYGILHVNDCYNDCKKVYLNGRQISNSEVGPFRTSTRFFYLLEPGKYSISIDSTLSYWKKSAWSGKEVIGHSDYTVSSSKYVEVKKNCTATVINSSTGKNDVDGHDSATWWYIKDIRYDNYLNVPLGKEMRLIAD